MTRAWFSAWTRRTSASEAVRVSRFSRALIRAKYWFLASAATPMARFRHVAMADSVASDAVVIPRSVTALPNPERIGCESVRDSSGFQ